METGCLSLSSRFDCRGRQDTGAIEAGTRDGKRGGVLLVFRSRYTYSCAMQHRHISPRSLTLAAIDDIIERGNRSDWVELRDSAASDRAILRKILRVCAAHSEDPGAQRYHLWRLYADRRVA